MAGRMLLVGMDREGFWESDKANHLRYLENIIV